MPFSSNKKHLLVRLATENKAGLPASIDDCVAYFTGYKKTTIPSCQDRSAFYDLARKSITYCNLSHDKETLHLLFYSIRKRFELWRFHTEFMQIWSSWDAIALDICGLYQGNTALQVQDMTRVFLALLSYMETKIDSNLNISPLIPWAVENSPNKTMIEEDVREEYPPLRKTWAQTWPDITGADNARLFFNRGGGLFNHLDMVKNLSPGLRADSSAALGYYVTPSADFTPSAKKRPIAPRDEFYATELKGARSYGDIPCFLSGFIPTESLYAENGNSYEAFIKTEDLASEPSLRLRIPHTSYEHLESNAYFDSIMTIEKYSPKDGLDKFFKERFRMICDISDTRDKEEKRKLKAQFRAAFMDLRLANKILHRLDHEISVLNKSVSSSEDKYVQLSVQMLKDIKAVDQNNPGEAYREIFIIINQLLPQFEEAPRWYEKIANAFIMLANAFQNNQGNKFSLFQSPQYKTVEEARTSLAQLNISEKSSFESKPGAPPKP